MSDIKPEDRLRRYNFNIDGKIVDFNVSDRALVNAVQNHDELVTLAYQTLDVIRLLKEHKPLPLGYFEAKVKATIDRLEEVR
jgi:hypothetical protein